MGERAALLGAWREGVERFNAGEYWEAHESWERGWKGLGEPMRSWVQGWIQLAGVLCLIDRRRPAAARALAARALELLERRPRPGLPRIEVEGGLTFLKRILEGPDGGEHEFLSEAPGALKARLLTRNAS